MGRSVLLSIAVLFLSSCQTSAPISPDQIENYSEIEYFLLVNKLGITGRAYDIRETAIRDWGRINDQALILSVAPDDRILVTLQEPCLNLGKARVIGFERALTAVVPDPQGRGFDIRLDFSNYLNPGDRMILAYSQEELDSIIWQQMGSTSTQLGECLVAQFLYLEAIEETEEEPS